MRHPVFNAGVFATAFITEEYPHGLVAADVPHEDLNLLAAIAIFTRRRYIDRAVTISNQLPGHQRQVGKGWVVLMEGRQYAFNVETIPGGYSLTTVDGGKTYDIVSDWLFRDLIFRGTCNGQPICMQVERSGMNYRITHHGKQVKATVITAKADRLLALMPEKPAPDLSKFLLSPMPGLLRELTVHEGQEVRVGEKLAIIEAMKMENILKAEKDGKVKRIAAQPGESLAVDQVIIEFE